MIFFKKKKQNVEKSIKKMIKFIFIKKNILYIKKIVSLYVHHSKEYFIFACIHLSISLFKIIDQFLPQLNTLINKR